MKRNFLIAVLMLVSLGVFTNSFAAAKKKKTPSTPVAPVDNSAAAPAPSAPPLAAPPKAPVLDVPAPRIISLGDSTKLDLNTLVADTAATVMDDYIIDTTRPSDGFYKTSTLRGAKPFAFPDEKINNIKKYKRLWRQIDLTDSANRIFAVPGETLMQSIMDAIKSGRLVAYKDDEFKKQLTYEQAISKFRDSSVAMDLDTTTGEVIGSHPVLTEFNPDSVTKFEIKEDIYFDKVRGRVVTEIISLCPIKKYKNSSGVYLFDQRPFFLYFKQLRKLLAAREVTDLPRDISNISYDDMFISRNFHSRIIKEASPSDLKISDKFKNEEDQIKESNRIEQEIRNFKKGMFKFY